MALQKGQSEAFLMPAENKKRDEKYLQTDLQLHYNISVFAVIY